MMSVSHETYDEHGTPTGSHQGIPASAVELVYAPDSDGYVHTQPLTDLAEVGTLIDPETGDDLVIVAVRLIEK